MSAPSLLDSVRASLNLDTDAALADALRIARSNLCHMRTGRVKIGPVAIVSIHEETGWPTKYIKQLLREP